MAPRSLPIGAADLRRIAVSASVDPRTVRRFLLGQPIAGTTRHRIEQALRRLEFDDLILPEERGAP